MDFNRSTPLDYDGTRFITDAGLETDLIFNRGQEIPEFAAHTLLDHADGREALADYYSPFLELASRQGFGFILDTQTWRAQPHFAEALGATSAQLESANRNSVNFSADLRRVLGRGSPVLLNGIIGPCGDGYRPDYCMSAQEAQSYHEEQIGWLANTEINMISALTLTYPEEAIGIVRAAQQHQLPVVISFTVETDGHLPCGVSLESGIRQVDEATQGYTSYFMVNCAHPDHFASSLTGDWTQRLRGVRCNASRCSHEELDQAETLDDGDSQEFGQLTAGLARKLPWLKVFGGCCGSDLRHVKAITESL